MFSSEKKPYIEEAKDNMSSIGEDDLADVTGGGPGVRTVYGIRDGWIATGPDRNKDKQPRYIGGAESEKNT